MEGYSFQVDASHETSQEAQAFESRYIAPFLKQGKQKIVGGDAVVGSPKPTGSPED
jgi:hypothetical protein